MDLKERKLRILKAIVDDYIETGLPIGSRTISENYGLGLSSATIRNEMAGLEEMGFLEQPHISSGRIPSDKAYRLYIERLMEYSPLDNDLIDNIQTRLDTKVNEIKHIMSSAVKALSEATNCVALAVAPRAPEVKIESFKLVKVSGELAILVIVTDSGEVYDSVLKVSLHENVVELINNEMNAELQGCKLRDAAKKINGIINNERQSYSDVLQRIHNNFTRKLDENMAFDIILGGSANILKYPEYSDIKKAMRLLAMLDEKEIMYNVLNPSDDSRTFAFRIGSENEYDGVKDCSVITTKCNIDDHHAGVFGVIGPTRMNYAKMFAILDFMNTRVRELMNQND